ncbi:Hypothetical_protein [Hexamita inflata]|uniref:Hypothetical_protein n=1 Tax=Hexamita inflata TaxID=28002 RepID=A0ABP1H6H7_9EUKA
MKVPQKLINGSQRKYKNQLHPIYPVEERKSEVDNIPQRCIKSLDFAAFESSHSESTLGECELVWDQLSEVDIRMKRISEHNGQRVVEDIMIIQQKTFNNTQDQRDDIFTLFDDL